VPHVVWFSDLRRSDIPLAGGKAANLGELTAAGIQVPPGFVVTAEGYAAVMAESGLATEVAEALVAAGERAADAASRIQQLFSGLDLPAALSSEIAAAYEALGRGPVAVRSSATAEDLAEASFAGQQSTYLNVEGEERLLAAVRDCWASLFEERAIDYRRRQGFGDQAKIAVVIQQMVQSERSGVMFTVNPVTGDAGQIIIEAVYGLGEAAVSGMVTPDMVVVDKSTGATLEREVSDQEQQLVRNSAATPGDEANHWSKVPSNLRRAAKLSDEDVTTLAALGLQLEQHYGCPQDIEWATADGQFYILQSRPVTAAGF
jgi:pyruvate,water dikinase